MPGNSSASVPSMTLSPELVFLSMSPFALTASDATTGMIGFPSSPAHRLAELNVRPSQTHYENPVKCATAVLA